MTSSMLERVMRATTAMGIVPRAMAGMTRCNRPSQNPAKFSERSESTSTSPVMAVIEVSVPRRPGNGNHPRFTKKTTIRIIASQKMGMLMPVRARTEVILSSSEYCLTAEITPTGTPTSTATSMANAVSSTVAGSRSRSSVVTGRPVTTESPRSPLTASTRNSPYWTMTGLSNPMLSLTCATCSWVACYGAHHEEHHERHPEQYRDDLQDPAPDELYQSPNLPGLHPRGLHRGPDPEPVLRAAARELNGVERLAAGRARLVALHALLKTQRWLRVGDGDPRRVLDQKLLRPHVSPLALVFVYGRLASLKQLVDLRVLVVGDVQCVRRRGARASEERVQEVIRVPVVPGPPKQGHRVVALAGPLQVRAPLVSDELSGHAHLREVGLHRLGDTLAVRHVRARDRHVPQLGLQVLLAGVLEQPLGLVGVEGVALDALVEEGDGGRHVGRRDIPGVPKEGLHDLVHIYGLVDSPAHVHVVERLLLGVHSQVPDGERRAELDLEPRVLDRGD